LGIRADNSLASLRITAPWVSQAVVDSPGGRWDRIMIFPGRTSQAKRESGWRWCDKTLVCRGYGPGDFLKTGDGTPAPYRPSLRRSGDKVFMKTSFYS
jgi:hypothetical protein